MEIWIHQKINIPQARAGGCSSPAQGSHSPPSMPSLGEGNLAQGSQLCKTKPKISGWGEVMLTLMPGKADLEQKLKK